MNMKSTIAAAALALALPVAGNAATLSTDGAIGSYGKDENLTGSIAITYEAGATDWSIQYFNFSATTGYAALKASIDFNGTTTSYAWIPGTGKKASIDVDDFTVLAGEYFTVVVDYLGGNAAGTYSFEAAPLPAVPVPAAGILLLTALGGLGVAARRKKA